MNKKPLRPIFFSQTKKHLRLAPYTFPSIRHFSHHHLVKDTDYMADARGSFAPQVFQVKKYVTNEEELQVIKVECMLCMPLKFNIGN